MSVKKVPYYIIDYLSDKNKNAGCQGLHAKTEESVTVRIFRREEL